MSKRWFYPLALAAVVACGNSKTEKTIVEQHAKGEEITTGELTLNNGVKWKADASTNQHAAALEKMANAFTALDSKETSDGQQFAAQVEKELVSLVQNCTMDGDAHEELHVWLGGVLNDVDHVKKAKDHETANLAAMRLANGLLTYHQYFE